MTSAKPPLQMEQQPKTVLLASPRGYCAGVDRAVVTVEKALDLYGAPVYVIRKEIVHNAHVVQTLGDRGAVFVEETDEVPEGALVVFSAHGVSPAVHEEAAAQPQDHRCNVPARDQGHNEAKRFAAEGYEIVLIGHEGHEEVEGTSGEAPERITLIENPEQADAVEFAPDAKVAWLSQTTLSVDETMETVERLRTRLPLLIDPPSDDICYATQKPPTAVKDTSRRVAMF